MIETTIKTSQFDFDQKTGIEDKKFDDDVICRNVLQQKNMIVTTNDEINLKNMKNIKLILNHLINNIIEINI